MSRQMDPCNTYGKKQLSIYIYIIGPKVYWNIYTYDTLHIPEILIYFYLKNKTAALVVFFA